MRYSLLYIFVWMCSVAHGSIFWQRSVVNYSRRTYMAANQNWMVRQAQNGWMYFANNQGLLEFDGVYWYHYEITNRAKLRSIKIAENRIYVGGLGQFGFFMPDEKGQLRYTSLSDQLKSGEKVNIWNIHELGNRVYFQADNDVYYLENDRLGKIVCKTGINYSTVIYNKLYVSTNDGLYVLYGNELKKDTHVVLPANANVVSMLPFDHQIMIVTSDHGVYLYDFDHLTEWETAAKGIIAQNKLTCAAVSKSRVALGTTQNGVILVNTALQHMENISMVNGLQNNTVLSAAFDKADNLWVGLDNGIDYVALNSPLFFLDSKSEAIGAGYCSVLYQNNLYLGTNQGVYRTHGAPQAPLLAETQFVEGTGGQVHCIIPFDNKLFCGGRNFFIMIDGTQVVKFPIRGVWHVCRVGNRDDLLLIGDYWGLKTLRKTGNSWTVSDEIEGVHLSAKNMMVEEGTHAVWVANKAMGLFRLTLDAQMEHVVSTKNYNTEQLPVGDNIYVATIDHEVVVAARQGLFRYDVVKDELVPYDRLEKQLSGKAQYTYISQDQQHNIWYVCDGLLSLLRYDPVKKTYFKHRGESYLNDELIEDFESVVTLDSLHAVIGTQEGFALLRYARAASSRQPVNLQIRRIVGTNGADTLLYGCHFYPVQRPLRFSYRDNSIRIEYSANNFDKSQTVLYSYRLEGAPDDTWSAYSPQHIKEYTNLREGSYTFQVRIVTDTNPEPIVTSLSFRILPPWYRSWWMYMVYFVLLAAVVYAVIYRILRGKRKLDQKIETLEDEKVQIELRSKENELMLSRMNVVRKNEMLMEIKKTAVSLNNSLKEENLPTIKRKVVRLIGQIDTNIEHDDDLEAFKNEFDTIHHNFLLTLGERFPQLTHKDKMLCVYLKMNMISKEIAPLLNISVRGVEISRYRLRKKLGLGEKESLSDFLRNLDNR